MQTYGLEKVVNSYNCPPSVYKKIRLKRKHVSRKKHARHDAREDIQRSFNDYMLNHK